MVFRLKQTIDITEVFICATVLDKNAVFLNYFQHLSALFYVIKFIKKSL